MNALIQQQSAYVAIYTYLNEIRFKVPFLNCTSHTSSDQQLHEVRGLQHWTVQIYRTCPLLEKAPLDSRVKRIKCPPTPLCTSYLSYCFTFSSEYCIYLFIVHGLFHPTRISVQ